MPTNVKVDRKLLIKELESEQRKQTEQFKREMEKFRAAEKLYPEKLAKALDSAAKKVRRGLQPECVEKRINGKYVDVPYFDDFPEKPKKPSEPRNTACNLQRQIRTLKMSTAETITVNENSEYVRFICNLNGGS